MKIPTDRFLWHHGHPSNRHMVDHFEKTALTVVKLLGIGIRDGYLDHIWITFK